MLMERIVYEQDSGQLLTGSFMDYAMPRPFSMPPIAAGHSSVPTKVNLLGTKGGSGAGNSGGPAAIINAILDALRPLGVEDLEVPARPEVSGALFKKLLLRHKPRLQCTCERCLSFCGSDR